MVALYFRDAFIAFTLPGGDRVLFIPGGKQLSLLAGKIQLVAVAHIEVGAGDGAACAGRGLGDFIFKIDLHGAHPHLQSAEQSFQKAFYRDAAQDQHTRKKSIDLEFIVWQRLAGLAQRRGIKNTEPAPIKGSIKQLP